MHHPTTAAAGSRRYRRRRSTRRRRTTTTAPGPAESIVGRCRAVRPGCAIRAPVPPPPAVVVAPLRKAAPKAAVAAVAVDGSGGRLPSPPPAPGRKPPWLPWLPFAEPPGATSRRADGARGREFAIPAASRAASAGSGAAPGPLLPFLDHKVPDAGVMVDDPPSVPLLPSTAEETAAPPAPPEPIVTVDVDPNAEAGRQISTRPPGPPPPPPKAAVELSGAGDRNHPATATDEDDLNADRPVFGPRPAGREILDLHLAAWQIFRCGDYRNRRDAGKAQGSDPVELDVSGGSDSASSQKPYRFRGRFHAVPFWIR